LRPILSDRQTADLAGCFFKTQLPMLANKPAT
jgi:hypothetical protein